MAKAAPLVYPGKMARMATMELMGKTAPMVGFSLLICVSHHIFHTLFIPYFSHPFHLCFFPDDAPFTSRMRNSDARCEMNMHTWHRHFYFIIFRLTCFKG